MANPFSSLLSMSTKSFDSKKSSESSKSMPSSSKKASNATLALTQANSTQLSIPSPIQAKKNLGTNQQNSTSSSTEKRKALTTIIAEIDIGWGNILYIRGEGSNLNWEQGVPMVNLSENTWAWKTNAASGLTFKFLLNDEVWAQGENLTAAPGSTSITKPNF